MEACACFLRRGDGTIGPVLLDTRFPLGARFIAPIEPEVHRKTDGATHLMTGDRIVREGIGVIAMMIMAIDIVEQTAYMLAQRVIQNQERVRFRTADRFRLLEQIRDATVIDTVLEPRRCGEEAGEVGFVRTLQHTAGAIGQTFVVQDDQTCQVMLEMVKLAPIRKEIAKEVRVGGHDGSRSHDGKLHEPFALSRRGWERA
jgi:hypothetical protein